MKKYQIFFFYLNDIFQFSEVKFSIYLNRCVFVMYISRDGPGMGPINFV